MVEFSERVRSTATTMASGRSLPWLLDLRAQQRPDHPFLVWEPFTGAGRAWTYAEFRSDVARAAAGLAARGVQRGDRVVVHMDNCPEFLVAWFACSWMGAVAVSTNTRSSRDEMSYFADHSNAVAAITQPKYVSLLDAAMPQAKWVAVASTDSGEDPVAGTEPGADAAFAGLLADDVQPILPLSPFEPASIQYTSGTTSRPKAVVWTHANALWGGKVSATHESLRSDDRHLVYLPLFHTNAQSYSVLATLWAGGTMVLQPRFSASRFWDASLRHQCTWTSLVPFVTRALQQHDVPDRHWYRLWGNGVSAPPSDELFRVKTIGWWGMTETVTHGIVDDPENPARSLACGRPAVEYEVLVTGDDGSPVEAGETGDLFVRGVPGVSLFAAYLHDPAATQAAVDEHGWLDTGDRVTVNEDGTITFADRDKDMLKVGGENVAASEVERVVLEVKGVVEAAVVAGRDPMLDEVPVCFVIVAGDRPEIADEILAACKDKLADFKVPREVRIVETMPRSTLEKIAKAELRALLDAESEPS